MRGGGRYGTEVYVHEHASLHVLLFGLRLRSSVFGAPSEDNFAVLLRCGKSDSRSDIDDATTRGTFFN